MIPDFTPIPSQTVDQARRDLQFLSYRFPTRTPMTLQAELAQIQQGVNTGYPRLTQEPVRDERLDVVGYGPTLRETWRLIQAPCLTMSGSHDFLIARGIVPTYHAQTDGRDHQVKFLEHPHRDVTYLMATICPPGVWSRLAGHQVRLWHNAHGPHVIDWIGQHDKGGLIVAGGSTIGLSALHLGYILGYRRFRLFGVDGHSSDGQRHAGPHYDPRPHGVIHRVAGGRRWATSPQMSNACDELLIKLDSPQVEIEIVGDSLQSALVDEYRIAQAFWTARQMELRLEWRQQMIDLSIATEVHRVRARYNTGTLEPAAATMLRSLAQWAKTSAAVEVGTFIGTSTLAIAREIPAVYTCDERNDCLPAQPGVHRFPGHSSTQMLARLAADGVKAGFFFFDGRIRSADLALIRQIATPDAIFVFDDFTGGEKGVVNVDLLRPHLEGYVLIRPAGAVRQVSTLAALIPESRL